MILYLMRHGHAGPESGSKPVLTPQGEKEVLRSARFLQGRGATPLAIWHSPKKRAQETAKRVAETLGIPPGRIVMRKDLGLDAGGADCVEEVESLTEGEWIWVSHQPTLQTLTHHLLGAEADSLHFPPAGVAALARDPGGSWHVIWTHPTR